jgi:hypothetical protein
MSILRELMLFIQLVSPILPKDIDYSASPMLWVIAHTQLLFPLLLGSLILVVEFGFRLRKASIGINGDRQSLVESARAELGVLLSLLLGFSLPMALPHYDHRNQLVVDEADAIITVQERAQLLPEPFRDRILLSLRDYVSARVEFGEAALNEPALLHSVHKAKQLQSEMWQDTAQMIQHNPNVVTPLFVQALGELPDLIEQRLAAEEKRIPAVIWLVVISISALTCFVVGYSMRQRFFLGMLVVPLTVAIVLSLVSELDNPGTGLVHDGQQSIRRLYLDLAAAPRSTDDNNRSIASAHHDDSGSTLHTKNIRAHRR